MGKDYYYNAWGDDEVDASSASQPSDDDYGTFSQTIDPHLTSKLALGVISSLAMFCILVYILFEIEMGKKITETAANMPDDMVLTEENNTNEQKGTIAVLVNASVVDMQSKDGTPPKKKKIKTKPIESLDQSKILELVGVAAFLTLMAFLLLVFLPSGSTWLSAIGISGVTGFCLRDQIRSEKRKERYDRISGVITLVLLLAASLSLTTYAQKGIVEGSIYKGSARIVGYDDTVYKNSAEDTVTRADLEVAWGGSWGCPLMDKTCYAVIEGSLCEQKEDRAIRRLTDTETNSTNTDDDEDEEALKAEIEQLQEELDSKEGEEDEMEEDTQYYKEEAEEEEEDKEYYKEVAQGEEEIADYYAEVVVEETEVIDEVVEDEEYYAEVANEDEEVYDEVVEDEEYYAEIAHEDEDIIDELDEEIEEEEYDGGDNEYDEELDVEDEEIEDLEIEEEEIEEEEVEVDDYEEVEELEVEEEVVYEEEEEIIEDEYYYPSYSFEDDHYEDDYWSGNNWGDAWGDYQCEELFETDDLSSGQFDENTPPGDDGWPFVNIYGKCNTCEAYIIDYFSSDHFNNIQSYEEKAGYYALLGLVTLFFTSFLVYKQRKRPGNERHIELLPNVNSTIV